MTNSIVLKNGWREFTPRKSRSRQRDGKRAIRKPAYLERRGWDERSLKRRNLHSYLHSFTFLKSKSNVYSCLEAQLRELKSFSPQGECGFKSRPGHQNQQVTVSVSREALQPTPQGNQSYCASRCALCLRSLENDTTLEREGEFATHLRGLSITTS